MATAAEYRITLWQEIMTAKGHTITNGHTNRNHQRQTGQFGDGYCANVFMTKNSV
jgi:hypothetical protein